MITSNTAMHERVQVQTLSGHWLDMLFCGYLPGDQVIVCAIACDSPVPMFYPSFRVRNIQYEAVV